MAEDITPMTIPSGEVIDRPAMDLVELYRHDAAEALSAGQVQQRLAAFAPGDNTSCARLGPTP
jgi:hypothetical protein